jgi:hypothetical protein
MGTPLAPRKGVQMKEEAQDHVVRCPILRKVADALVGGGTLEVSGPTSSKGDMGLF